MSQASHLRPVKLFPQELQRWQQLSKVLGPEDLALEALDVANTLGSIGDMYIKKYVS